MKTPPVSDGTKVQQEDATDSLSPLSNRNGLALRLQCRLEAEPAVSIADPHYRIVSEPFPLATLIALVAIAAVIMLLIRWNKSR